MSGALNTVAAISSLGFAGQSAPVSIGNVVLTGSEVPSFLRVEGEQSLSIVTLPGGNRSIQCLGPNPGSLILAGMFVGPSAQARALLLAQMRDAGAAVPFSLGQIAATVVVHRYSYSLEQKGAVVRYQVELEILPSQVAVGSTNSSSLSALVGADTAAAITSITNTIADAASYATGAISQVQTDFAQAQPLATLVGLGGPLATASTYLQGAAFVSQATTNFAAVPSSAATMIVNLQGAGNSLMASIGQSSDALTGLQSAANPGDLFADPASLSSAVGYSEVLSSSVQAGSLVNRALANASLATSAASLPSPVVHA